MASASPHLFEAAASGDRDALAELFRTYQAPLLRYLRARRIAAHDDVAAEVWVDVARSIERFSGGEDDFRRWLFTIAHRRSVDAVRRAVRRDEHPIDARQLADTEAGGTAAGADVEQDRQASLDRAMAMLTSLPDNLAEAVMLRVVFDLPIRDVAAVMDTTEGNVRVLVHRGTERLRRKLRVTDADAPTMRVVS